MAVNITFDVIAWVNGFFDNQHNINREDISIILDFCLVWNTFESLACSRHATPNSIEQAVQQLHSANRIQINSFMPYLNYFQGRYIEAGHTNRRFSQLLFRSPDKEALVADVLLGNNTSPDGIVLALLIIVFRLRNNLFHGEKAVSRLKYQVDNFNVANQVVATFLDQRKELMRLGLA